MRSKYEIIAQKELEANGYVVDFKTGLADFLQANPRTIFISLILLRSRKGKKLDGLVLRDTPESQHDIVAKWDYFLSTKRATEKKSGTGRGVKRNVSKP